jgi:endonuclease/exonuclease/phosphatase family metal-dependent hydrolase
MPTIAVATLNLRGRHDRWLERRELIVAELVDLQPDLLSLQEIHRPSGQGHWLRRQVNMRLSGSPRRPYRLFQKRKAHPLKGFREGIGVLCRMPALSHDAISLGYGGRVALRVNVELETGQSVDFVAVHLHHPAAEREARLEQVVRLQGWLNDDNRVPLQVIAGDFNELPDGPAIRQMRQLYHSAFVEARGYDPVATFPTALAVGPTDWSGCLDYIFVSGAMPAVAEATIICKRPAAYDPNLYPSDHVGLLARLVL